MEKRRALVKPCFLFVIVKLDFILISYGRGKLGCLRDPCLLKIERKKRKKCPQRTPTRIPLIQLPESFIRGRFLWGLQDRGLSEV